MDYLKELMKYKENCDEIKKIDNELQILYLIGGICVGLAVGLTIGFLIW